MIRIYDMNGSDYMAAKTQKEAVKCFLEDYDGNKDDMNVERLSPIQMCEMEFREEDGTQKSFRLKLNEMIAADEKFPCLFASTEF